MDQGTELRWDVSRSAFDSMVEGDQDVPQTKRAPIVVSPVPGCGTPPEE